MALNLLSDTDQITVSDADIVDDGQADVSYTIRKITPEKMRQIVRANTKPGNHRREEKIDWMGVQDDQLDHLLVSWTGILSSGKPAECNRANKLTLDGPRKVALIDRAGTSEAVAVQEAREQAKFPAS
jgi:hypothetical protein